jgi:hypothetical protein
MIHHGWWRQILRYSVLAAGLFTAPGCLSFVHPVAPPEPGLTEPCGEIPQECKSHVYVFLVNGLDPGNCANLNGLRDYIQSLGFTKTYYGQLYHAWYFDDELHRLHHEDPEARFVLIGFSFGANVVCAMANSAKEENIPIDLLVYAGGNTLENTEYCHPSNAMHITNILASGCIWNGTELDGAEELRVPDVHHFGSPCHAATVEMLLRELPVVAARVPVIVKAPAPPRFPDEEAPTPRPVTRAPDGPADDWDFLKPVSRLAAPASSEVTMSAIAHGGSP